ncbi:MAG: putative snRNA-associated protein, Sm class [Streblomastix strix]|uniref:Putative snRNA-associated protein, Sm class n=1 Tax=Streblomastix strix TaxID=222440 RepID=A0A5J4X5H7_9EUKA|nr:MAG: putative snRNA-associated protein, Sm class [Streblomastix strix]
MTQPSIFQQFFQNIVGQNITVELKNDVTVHGTLKMIDKYMNLKLTLLEIIEKDKYPQLFSVKELFIRASSVRYIHMDPKAVDLNKIQQEAANQGIKEQVQQI